MKLIKFFKFERFMPYRFFSFSAPHYIELLIQINAIKVPFSENKD